MKPENLATTRFALVLASVLGVIASGSLASSSVSGSLPAILYMLAGFGFTGIFIYYFIVRGVEENNNKE